MCLLSLVSGQRKTIQNTSGRTLTTGGAFCQLASTAHECVEGKNALAAAAAPRKRPVIFTRFQACRCHPGLAASPLPSTLYCCSSGAPQYRPIGAQWCDSLIIRQSDKVLGMIISDFPPMCLHLAVWFCPRFFVKPFSQLSFAKEPWNKSRASTREKSFCSQMVSGLVRDLKMTKRVIFVEWPKLYLGLDERPESPILKEH